MFDKDLIYTPESSYGARSEFLDVITMAKVYKLVELNTTTEATKYFFKKNKFFFAKRLTNGHFKFVGSNREVLETSTCQQFDKEATGDVVITTRNSRIQIAPVIDDSEWLRVKSRSGAGVADVQYLNGLTAAEIGAKIALVALSNGYTLRTFKTSVSHDKCNAVLLTVTRGEIFDNDYQNFIFTIHIDKYEFLGKSAKLRITPWKGECKTISLAGSPNQINKKIKSLLA